MTLSEKLNQIIREQNISKAEFVRRVGISATYLYILTGESRMGTEKNKNWLLSDENE